MVIGCSPPLEKGLGDGLLLVISFALNLLKGYWGTAIAYGNE
ncbi:MAG: hypothetical protein AAGA60_09765 [Cyanobacteria bacterium P01_E01_bin.42]